PTYARRGEMAAGYLALGKAQAAGGKWDAALVSFQKAFAVDPKGAQAKSAEAELYLARANHAKAAGQPADEDLARALALDPTLAEVKTAADDAAKDEVKQKKGWMLYAGLGSGGLALFLFAVALVLRRR